MEALRKDSAIFSAYDGYEGFDPAMPERGLMLAILRAAIEDFHSEGRSQREAVAYLLSNESYYLFSFVSICTYLKICPHILRIRLGLVPPTLKFLPN